MLGSLRINQTPGGWAGTHVGLLLPLSSFHDGDHFQELTDLHHGTGQAPGQGSEKAKGKFLQCWTDPFAVSQQPDGPQTNDNRVCYSGLWPPALTSQMQRLHSCCSTSFFQLSQKGCPLWAMPTWNYTGEGGLGNTVPI